MTLSLTSQYALRAMIYLAQHADDWPIPGRRIAEQAKIPAKYLSKILGDLVRCGVLASSPGRTGGFHFRRAATKTRLLDVLAPFEPFDHRRCPFGNQECGDRNPCLAHREWKKVVELEQRFLQNTSVHDVAVSDGKGERKTKRKKK